MSGAEGLTCPVSGKNCEYLSYCEDRKGFLESTDPPQLNRIDALLPEVVAEAASSFCADRQIASLDRLEKTTNDGDTEVFAAKRSGQIAMSKLFLGGARVNLH